VELTREHSRAESDTGRPTGYAEERRIFVEGILENIRNDVVTGVNQEINMIKPVIDKEFIFED